MKTFQLERSKDQTIHPPGASRPQRHSDLLSVSVGPQGTQYVERSEKGTEILVNSQGPTTEVWGADHHITVGDEIEVGGPWFNSVGKVNSRPPFSSSPLKLDELKRDPYTPTPVILTNGGRQITASPTTLDQERRLTVASLLGDGPTMTFNGKNAQIIGPDGEISAHTTPEIVKEQVGSPYPVLEEVDAQITYNNGLTIGSIRQVIQKPDAYPYKEITELDLTTIDPEDMGTVTVSRSSSGAIAVSTEPGTIEGYKDEEDKKGFTLSTEGDDRVTFNGSISLRDTTVTAGKRGVRIEQKPLKGGEITMGIKPTANGYSVYHRRQRLNGREQVTDVSCITPSGDGIHQKVTTSITGDGTRRVIKRTTLSER